MSDVRLVLFFGSRDWRDSRPIAADLDTLDPERFVVLHGDCNGADEIADALARERGIHVARVGALWGKFGKGAGYKRNRTMAALGPARGFGYVSGSEGSPLTKGSRMMLDLAQAAGVPCEVRRGWDGFRPGDEVIHMSGWGGTVEGVRENKNDSPAADQGPLVTVRPVRTGGARPREWASMTVTAGELTLIRRPEDEEAEAR